MISVERYQNVIDYYISVKDENMSSMDSVAREMHRQSITPKESTEKTISSPYPQTHKDIIKFLSEHKDIDYAIATLIECLIRYSIEKQPRFLKIAKDRFDIICS